MTQHRIMTIEEMLAAAETLCIVAHSGVKRKDGTAYVEHPRRVAQAAALGFLPTSSLAYIVGLLHDVVEDSSITLEALREAGFSYEVINAVDALTRRKKQGETYRETSMRVAANPLARVVKMADLKDNMADQSALDDDEKKFFEKRYGRALRYLETGKWD